MPCFNNAYLVSVGLCVGLLACGDSSAPGGGGNGAGPAVGGQGGQAVAGQGPVGGAGGDAPGGMGPVGGQGGSGGEPAGGDGAGGEPVGGAPSSEDIADACTAFCTTSVDCSEPCAAGNCVGEITKQIGNSPPANETFCANGFVDYLNCQAGLSCALFVALGDDTPPDHPCYDIAQQVTAMCD